MYGTMSIQKSIEDMVYLVWGTLVISIVLAVIFMVNSMSGLETIAPLIIAVLIILFHEPLLELLEPILNI